jgi:ATP-dependent Clp protease protease subunit
LKKVEAALERDNFMSPEEAKEFGLIDEILQTRPKTGDEES